MFLRMGLQMDMKRFVYGSDDENEQDNEYGLPRDT